MGLEDSAPAYLGLGGGRENRSLKVTKGIGRDRRKFVFATQLPAPEYPASTPPQKVGGRVHCRKLEATRDHRDQNVSSLLGR